MASTATSGFQLKRLRGLLEKKGSDGAWRAQYFTAHKAKLYYVDPGADPSAAPPRAAMDLLDGLQKIERRGEKLVLWVDSKRRHQVRAVAHPRKQDGVQPSLDEWELSLRERRLVAKARRDKKARRPEEETEDPRRRPPSVSREARTPPAPRARSPVPRAAPFSERGDRRPSPAEQASWDNFVARQARESPRLSEQSFQYGASPADSLAYTSPRKGSPPRPRVGAGAPLGARPRDESALDEFLASDIERLSTPQLARGLRAAGCRSVPPDDVSLRQRARELQASLLGQPPPSATPRSVAPPEPPVSNASFRYSHSSRGSEPVSNASFQYGASPARGYSPRAAPAPAAAAYARSAYVVDDAPEEDDDRAARAKIMAFYREHNPSKVQDVDALIAKYRDVGVGASELLIAVQKKYAREQPQRRANQFSV